MKRSILLMALACAMLAQPLRSAQPKEGGTMPKVGEIAPDFKLQYFDGHELKDVSLSQYRGKQQIVLAFYVFAFTGG